MAERITRVLVEVNLDHGPQQAEAALAVINHLLTMTGMRAVRVVEVADIYVITKGHE